MTNAQKKAELRAELRKNKKRKDTLMVSIGGAENFKILSTIFK